MARTICGEEHYPAPLLAVAGHALPGAGRPFPPAPLGEARWTALLSAAATHRVSGLLVSAVHDGAFPATGVQQAQARAVHRAGAARVLALEAELVEVVGLLSGAGIGSRVLKGAAVAHLDHARPELRSYVDIDVLVRAGDVDGAVRVLTAAGFARTLAEPRPGFDRRFDKSITLRSPAGIELDLHRTFVLGPWGLLVDLDALWDEGAEVVVNGRALRALSADNRFVHACYHATLGNWPLRLGTLRDVAEMLRGPHGAALSRLGPASAWGVEAVVAAAVADSRRLLGIRAEDELTAWAQRYVPTRREERWLALHTQEDKTFAAQAFATLRTLPRWRDKLAYARALAMPDPEYTAGRHSSAPARFRYAAAELLRGRGRRS